MHFDCDAADSSAQVANSQMQKVGKARNLVSRGLVRKETAL
jgi:hypothetical protein